MVLIFNIINNAGGSTWRGDRDDETTHVAAVVGSSDLQIRSIEYSRMKFLSANTQPPEMSAHEVRNNGDLTVIRDNVPVYTSIGNTKCLL